MCACVSGGSQIKSTHTCTGLPRASCVSRLGPVAKEMGPGLNASNKYLGGYRSGSRGGEEAAPFKHPCLSYHKAAV